MFTKFTLMVAIIVLLKAVTINAEQKMTFSTISQKGTKVFNISNAVLTEAFNRMGYSFELVSFPAKRAASLANSGHTDGDAHRIHAFGKRFKNLIRIDESMQTIEQSVFSKRNDIKVGGWSSLAKYKVIYLPGVPSTLRGLKKGKVPKKNMIKAFNYETAFKMLNQLRGDVFVISQSSGIRFLRKFGLENSGIKAVKPPLVEIKLFPYIHKKHTHLAKKLLRTMQKIKKDGTYEKIVAKIE